MTLSSLNDTLSTANDEVQTISKVDFLEGLKENVKDIRHVTASLENEM
jgi:hypothetical protein